MNTNTNTTPSGADALQARAAISAAVMADRYQAIREALEALDAAGGDWISWETAFVKYAKASQPDTIRALLAERDALREALTEVLRVNETDAGNDVRSWANAMLNAHAALAQEQGGSDAQRNPD